MDPNTRYWSCQRKRISSPRSWKKSAELVNEGATVVGPRPTRSHGLFEWQLRDERVQELAEELWADCDGKTIFENPVGDGKIIWGLSLKEILFERGVGPDFSFTGNVPETSLDFIHRKNAEGTEIYFIRNATDTPVFGTGTLRQSGKNAEYWDPASGSMYSSGFISNIDNLTRLPITLDPYGSVFIVFSGQSSGHGSYSIQKDGNMIFPLEEPIPHIQPPFMLYEGGLLLQESGDYHLYGAGTPDDDDLPIDPYEESIIEGPWQVNFPESSGGPGTVHMDPLIYWNDHPDDAIRFFSGIATYDKEFTLPEEFLRTGKKTWLEFDKISEVARITLNGVDLGICWKPPFRVDISDAVKAGRNHLTIEVANTWANGLCGDARLPAAERRTKSNVTRLPNAWTHPFAKIPNEDYPLIESGIKGRVYIRTYEYLLYNTGIP